MANTTYISLSVQDALRRQMDIIAHNMANIGTGAFKSEKPIFVEVLDEAGGVAYVQDSGIVRDMSPGTLQVTGGQLDVAVQGDAFLVVAFNDEVRYTRNGHLQLNEGRELVTSTGYPVLDVDERKIELPLGSDEISISPDGTVSAGGGPIARIKLVAFADANLLERAADSLYATDLAAVEPREAVLVQGTLEMSNVKPVVHLTDMINVLRAYQQNTQLSETDHTLQMDTINTVIQA
jgi:flagellar basal-body rod protein FlgF